MEEGESILEILDTVTALDLVDARAKHAKWLSAVRPSFLPEEEADTAYSATNTVGALSIRGMRHPLLLQVCAPPSISLSLCHQDVSA